MGQAQAKIGRKIVDDSDRQESILLDVLNEDCHYEEVVELPVDGPFLKVDGTPNMVKVPSVGDILGDKLTAYAQHNWHPLFQEDPRRE